MHIGSHVSIRKGFLGAARTAMAIGATGFQFFPKNPRALGVKSLDEKDAQACRTLCKERGLRSIAHTSYPVNLAAPEPDSRSRILASVRNDMEIADACGADGLVVHFGKHGGADLLDGYKRIIEALNLILRDWRGEAKLLLENQAGEGTRIGLALEEMTHIRKLCDYPERIGFCLDTCHAFASGLWDGRNTEALLAKGRELGYWPELAAVHLNDSVYPYRSGKDRHAPLGAGRIGLEGLCSLVLDRELRQALLVLETPVPAGRSHREEIAMVREWFR